eukprot:scaffold65_cov233-Pinguiococcus_pyrenoidosus.AAC.5
MRWRLCFAIDARAPPAIWRRARHHHPKRGRTAPQSRQPGGRPARAPRHAVPCYVFELWRDGGITAWEPFFFSSAAGDVLTCPRPSRIGSCCRIASKLRTSNG